MTVTIMNLYDGYAQATEAVSNLERREFRIATSALSQTILIIGTLKIPPEGPRAVPLPSIVIATSRRSGRRSRHGCWNRRHGGVVGLRDVGLEPARHRSSSRFPFRFTLA